MSPQRPSSFHFALCLVAVATVVTAAFLWLGLTPLTAVLAAVVLSCPLAALYAWWLARRTAKTVERAMPGMTAGGKPPRRQS